MRISDWSSDVCSSDLVVLEGVEARELRCCGADRGVEEDPGLLHRHGRDVVIGPHDHLLAEPAREGGAGDAAGLDVELRGRVARSEERSGGKGCGGTCRSRWSADT